VLAVKHLRAGYGSIPILGGVSLSVADGEYVGVLGHNGMGKTTMLRTLMGILPVNAGEIRYDGRDITRDRPHQRARAGIGYVPQGRDIFSNLSVLDNLRMGCVMFGRNETSTIEMVLEEFPRLRSLLDRLGGALSGGEQQLLALARCLCGGPRLVLLDEPTEGIQPSIIDEIAETLLRLRDQQNFSLVLVEQNLEFIAAVSSRVLILQKGQLVREVHPDDLHDPDLVNEFLGVRSQ
jgi:branched-chain amino acid transport system ATP-binding protein